MKILPNIDQIDRSKRRKSRNMQWFATRWPPGVLFLFLVDGGPTLRSLPRSPSWWFVRLLSAFVLIGGLIVFSFLLPPTRTSIRVSNSFVVSVSPWSFAFVRSLASSLHASIATLIAPASISKRQSPRLFHSSRPPPCTYTYTHCCPRITRFLLVRRLRNCRNKAHGTSRAVSRRWI